MYCIQQIVLCVVAEQTNASSECSLIRIINVCYDLCASKHRKHQSTHSKIANFDLKIHVNINMFLSHVKHVCTLRKLLLSSTVKGSD